MPFCLPLAAGLMFRYRRRQFVSLAAIAVAADALMAVCSSVDESRTDLGGQERQVSQRGTDSVSDSVQPLETDAPSPGAHKSGLVAKPDLSETDSRENFDMREEAEGPSPGTSLPSAHVSDSIQPDLVNLAPSDLDIQYDDRGARILHFTNSILNQGLAPLEVHGRPNPESGLTDVFQRIYSADGLYRDRIVGSFFFHPDHEHWHIEYITRYELWTVDSEDVPGRRVLRTVKASWCLRDDAHLAADPHPEAWPDVEVYTGCENDIQGLSPGWMDVYLWDTPGQEIDVTGLPNGTYVLVSTANPDGILSEIDLNNNAGSTRFQLTGDRIVILDTSIGLVPPSPAIPPFRKT